MERKVGKIKNFKYNMGTDDLEVTIDIFDPLFKKKLIRDYHLSGDLIVEGRYLILKEEEMPNYTFFCKKCNEEKILSMPIQEYIKKEPKLCDECSSQMHRKIKSVKADVERSTDQIMMDVHEQVQKDLDNLALGDEKTMRDIYGDDPNNLP